MATVPVKIAPRLIAGIKKFQPILASAKSRDVNESDTVLIVTDLLHEVFGYDKYSEITREHAIRGTYCDLAVRLDGSVALLIEVKAIGLDLKDQFVKQAIDYASNQGCDWVVLTNGINWRVFKVVFAKPIEHELIMDFSFLELNSRKDDHIAKLWLLAKESWQKAALGEYFSQSQARSRFLMAAVILSEPVLEVMRRELRRISPGVRIDVEDIAEIVLQEVLKRDTVDGDKAAAARKLVAKALSKPMRATRGGATAVNKGLPSDSGAG